MSELNKTETVKEVEHVVQEQLDENSRAFVTESLVNFAMKGQRVGVETAEALVERLCGENDWTYREHEDGFAIARERWRLQNLDGIKPESAQ